MDMREGEGSLIEAARRGAPGAFERLALPLADRVWSVLAGLAGEGEAEDLLQETLLRAFRGLGTFRGEAGFGRWLICIAVNTARKHLAKKRPVTLAVGGARGGSGGSDGEGGGDDPPPDPLDELPGPASDPPALASLAEEAERVRAAVARLPWEEREALILRELEDLSYAEIAREVEATPAAVRSRLHRARRRLAGQLGGR